MAHASISPISRRRALRRIALVAVGAIVVPSLAALDGCTDPAPRRIAYGEVECAWCRMMVSDARYGALTLTDKGRQQVFDSVECLAQATLALESSAQALAGARSWVTDYPRPGELVPAAAARFLRSEGPGSPMGKGFKSFASVAGAEREQRSAGGVTMSWDELLTVIGGERGEHG